MGNRTLYLRNLASTMLGNLKVVPQESWFEHCLLPQHLYEHYSERVKQQLRNKMTPETRGRIADCGLAWNPAELKGKTSLYQVHCGSYLEKYVSGRDLVTEIACTAIIAEMADILYARRQSKVA